ncbi:hypothetical protein [Paenibacillus alvei]|uniref:Uncharacterized protein n=1 Tax=Paenibacillus alvei TaxID=44250 RepID=A0A383RGR8_PAEAL|nr:hypothetical protein [Paenibacillus alvei]SYX86013.1 conserved protein of unknown function [Paenibacillus alvei]
MIYKNTKINCTQEELDEFINNISIKYEIRGFDEDFNGHKIENPTGDPAAKYYVLQVGDRVYLQPHAPYQQGFIAIKEVNVHKIVNEHAEKIIDEMIINNFAISPEGELQSLRRLTSELMFSLAEKDFETRSIKQGQANIMLIMAKNDIK